MLSNVVGYKSCGVGELNVGDGGCDGDSMMASESASRERFAKENKTVE